MPGRCRTSRRASRAWMRKISRVFSKPRNNSADGIRKRQGWFLNPTSMRFCTFVLAITGVAWAGGCTETPTRDAFHSATLVFEGRVEKGEPVGGYTLHSHELDLQQPLTGAPAVVTF